MDRIKVFLSSAMTGELNEERAVIKAVFGIDRSLIHLFELLTISDNAYPYRIDKAYKDLVKKSNIIILVLNKELRQAVVEEFNEAINNNKKIFCYIKSNKERDEELISFIHDTIYNHYTSKDFTDSVELSKIIVNDLSTDLLNEYTKSDTSLKIDIENYNTVQLNEYYFSRDKLNELLLKDEIRKMSTNELIDLSLDLSNKYGRYKEALLYLEIALIREPNNWALYNNKGLILQNMGMVKLAIHSFELSRNFKINDVTLYNLGTLYYENEEYEKAITCFDQSLNMNSGKYETVNYLTNCYIKIKKFSKALEYAERAYTLNKDDVIIISNLSLALSYNDKCEEGLIIIEQIKDTNRYLYFRTKLLINRIQNNYDDIFTLADNIINDHYLDYDVYNIKLEAFIKLSLIDEAISLMNEMSSKFIISPSDYNNFGFALMECYYYNDAIPFFNKALEINPYIVQSWQNLQVCYAQISEFDLALQTCNKALNYFPNDKKTLGNKGSILINQGKITEGFGVFIQLLPDSIDFSDRKLPIRDFIIEIFNKHGINLDNLDALEQIWNKGDEQEKMKIKESFSLINNYFNSLQNNIFNIIKGDSTL